MIIIYDKNLKHLANSKMCGAEHYRRHGIRQVTPRDGVIIQHADIVAVVFREAPAKYIL